MMDLSGIFPFPTKYVYSFPVKNPFCNEKITVAGLKINWLGTAVGRFDRPEKF